MVHDEGGKGRTSVVDDFVEKSNKVIRDRRQLKISELSADFPQISRSVYYDIGAVKSSTAIDYRKFCARWFHKLHTGVYKKQQMCSALTALNCPFGSARVWKEKLFFRKDRIRRRNIGNIVNTETNEQSKQWIPTNSPNKLKKIQTILSNRKLRSTVFYECTFTCIETLQYLRRARQNKKRGMLSSGIVLLHDHERPHTAA